MKFRPRTLSSIRQSANYTEVHSACVIGVGVAPCWHSFAPLATRRWQSFCRRSDRSSFGSTATFFKGYVLRCPPMEEKCEYLDPLQTESVLYSSIHAERHRTDGFACRQIISSPLQRTRRHLPVREGDESSQDCARPVFRAHLFSIARFPSRPHERCF